MPEERRPPRSQFEATVEQVSGASGELPRSSHHGDVSVVVLSGGSQGTHRALGSKVRIGKAPDNDLVIQDDMISRHHCEVIREGSVLRVRDLGSTNGTFIDAARITEVVVPVGTVIRLGPVEIAFRPNLESLELEPWEDNHFGSALGQSVAMRRIFRLIQGIAKTEATVLLTGETGTGKEVLARAVVENSARADKPFVTVDCGAVTYSLLESELFGHERGAFTGAIAQRQGAFALAEGGTLFLDEIGELPLDVQPKLLRVLEMREFRRVGGNQVFKANVRIVAATKRDLEREVAAGKFREDLYFRLAVVPIRIPPLRARREDIQLLVQHILGSSLSHHELELSNEAMNWLLQHDWPGNVRELRNVLERAVYLSQAAGSKKIVIPAMPQSRGSGDVLFNLPENETFRQTKARFEAAFERWYVETVLGKHANNLAAAARAVQMDRKHLYELAKKHGIRKGTGEAES